jgi:chorismate dehydratase
MAAHWTRVIGRVSFVNCDPLYHALPESWSVLPAPPAWLTGHLLRRDCLTAPIPTADYAAHHDELQLLKGLGILSDGPVGSVLLFSTRPLERIRDVALPSDSSTSSRLLMHLLGARGMDPRMHQMGPDLNEMLSRCDAALLIGDRALDEAERNPELVAMDLGAEWKELTGSPMVFGVFAARRDAPSAILEEVACVLNEQLRGFTDDPDFRNAVLESTAQRSGFSLARVSNYFDEVRFKVGEPEVEGLNRFLDEVCGMQDEVQWFS